MGLKSFELTEQLLAECSSSKAEVIKEVFSYRLSRGLISADQHA